MIVFYKQSMKPFIPHFKVYEGSVTVVFFKDATPGVKNGLTYTNIKAHSSKYPFKTSENMDIDVRRFITEFNSMINVFLPEDTNLSSIVIDHVVREFRDIPIYHFGFKYSNTKEDAPLFMCVDMGSTFDQSSSELIMITNMTKEDTEDPKYKDTYGSEGRFGHISFKFDICEEDVLDENYALDTIKEIKELRKTVSTDKIPAIFVANYRNSDVDSFLEKIADTLGYNYISYEYVRHNTKTSCLTN
jgi:hypothetical protein